jgi:DNA polymerase I
LAVNLRLAFWLLDLNPKVDKEAGKVDIWLWGITESGDRVLVVDRNFSAYFYAVLQEGADAQKVADSIKLIYAAAVSSVEVVSRRFFGKPVTALKVTCKDATATSKVAKQIRTVSGVEDCLEDDIRAVMRYLLDNGLVPCSWVEAEVTEEENVDGMRVAHVYSAQTPPKQLERVEAPQLRVLGFNLLCYSREGTPKADRNPLLVI